MCSTTQPPIKKSKVEPYHKPATSRRTKKEPFEDFMVKTMQDMDSQVQTMRDKELQAKDKDIDDPDYMFCKSLVSRLKGLSPKKNRLARINVFVFNIYSRVNSKRGGWKTRI